MTKSTFVLNHRAYPFREGMTVHSVMVENNFDFVGIIVKINGMLIEEEVWKYAAITAGDNVEIIHIFGGG
jgi:thiamine biosynthesis protein ThiS